jgi:hypothetical protein
LKQSQLIPPTDKSDQNADANGNGNREQWPLLGLPGNAFERVVAGASPEPHGAIAEACGLAGGNTPAAAKAITDFAKERPERIGDLIPGGGSPDGRIAAGLPAYNAEVFLYGAKMAHDVGEPWIEFSRPAMKHLFISKGGLLPFRHIFIRRNFGRARPRLRIGQRRHDFRLRLLWLVVHGHAGLRDYIRRKLTLG